MSGTRTPNHPLEYDRFKHAAARAILRGDIGAAGALLVGAEDIDARRAMKKAHKPNLGPYGDDNPCVCVDCGKLRVDWSAFNEECRP